MPVLVIVGGPNGSGKTTLTNHLIARGRIKTHVINPDDIAKVELGSFNFQVKAARIALERRREALINANDFAFETTFSGKSEISNCLTAKAAGFQTVLYYITLQSVMDNINRVEERELNMGHPVDVQDIARRYSKSKVKLIEVYPFV
jgi:predicted ABC-type ATPase